MKTKELVALLGGVAVGAAIGVLLAPDKGDVTRARVIAYLEKKGISTDRLDEIVYKVKAKIDSYNELNNIEDLIDEIIVTKDNDTTLTEPSNEG